MAENELVVAEQVREVAVPGNPFWDDLTAFERVMRIAKMWAASSMVPDKYQGNVANVVIALEIAHRCGMSPMAVMQGLYVVKGKPVWAGQTVLALIKSCGRYRDVHYEGTDEELRLVAVEKSSGREVRGPVVTMAMAEAEGWLHDGKDKNGKFSSKWKTMPGLIIKYRAATFFGRTECPDVLQGMSTVDEIEDIEYLPQAMPSQPQGDSGSIIDMLPPADPVPPIDLVTQEHFGGSDPVMVRKYKESIDKMTSAEQIDKWRSGIQAALERDLPSEGDQMAIYAYAEDAYQTLKG